MTCSTPRLPDLIAFAQLHSMKIGTIEDLISYRRRTEKLVEKIQEEPFDSHTGGEFRLMIYDNASYIRCFIAAAEELSIRRVPSTSEYRSRSCHEKIIGRSTIARPNWL